MSNNSIGVGVITRNSEKTIKACVESFIDHVDQCVIVFAGESTDKTEKIVAKLKKKYGQKIETHDFEWINDFSAARNFCFSKLKTDWLVWCDSDDEMYQAENLRKIVETLPPEVGAVWFQYHYAIDEFGNVITEFIRERLLRAKFGWIWRSRLHETVSPLQECKFIRSDDVIVLHHHQATGEDRQVRNIKHLELMYKEDPAEKRVWLYFGHQYFAAREWTTAVQWYLKFGTDAGAIPVERYQALCYACKALRELRDKQAIEIAYLAIDIFPNYRDAYLELANAYAIIGDWDKSIHWAAISDIKELMVETPNVIFINPLDYTFNKYCLLSQCYLMKGNLVKALEYTQEAHKVRPTKDIVGNIQYIQSLLAQDKVSNSIKILATHLLDNKELVKLPHFLHAIPFWWRDTEDYKMLKSGIEHYTKDMKSEPQVVESEDKKSVTVNVANTVGVKDLLSELDTKYEKVTIVSPRPSPESKQIDVLSQTDCEALVNLSPKRRVWNLQKEPSRIICEYYNKESDNLKVRMYLGQGLEYWSPKTIREQGCGGSETAAAWVCRELARQGC